MINYKYDSKRQAFRFIPGKPGELDIIFLEKKVSLVNISAGGISFKNDNFAIGEQDLIVMELNEPKTNFKQNILLTVQILTIDAHDICHCRFIDLDQEDTELLHRYVLMGQKQLIRKQKNE